MAGVYGLVAALTGAGGSAAQLSMYLYSVIGLIALVWGLRAIAQVRPDRDPILTVFTHLITLILLI